jgi:hypothetical protein
MTFWDKYYGKMLFPVVIFGLFTLSFGVRELLSKRCAKWFPRSSVPLIIRLISLFQFIVVALYTFIVSTVFQPFNCIKQSDGSYTMTKSPSYKCYDEQWNKNVAPIVMFILVYCIGFPAALGYIFLKNQSNLDSVHFRVRFGNLISPYSRKYFYWELVVMLKRSLFIVSNDFLTINTDYISRYFVGIGILCFFFWLDVTCSPYAKHEMNLVQSS